MYNLVENTMSFNSGSKHDYFYNGKTTGRNVNTCDIVIIINYYRSTKGYYELFGKFESRCKLSRLIRYEDELTIIIGNVPHGFDSKF